MNAHDTALILMSICSVLIGTIFGGSYAFVLTRHDKIVLGDITILLLCLGAVISPAVFWATM